ncbi:dipicolinate synthase subunit DpsA [Virgibacillus soli]|uniref:Dipicolinate synthase subunit DpsA n=1 Tax=Paracerasibacillus soli TaxID=480284 RepID=A0ABU5CSS3_9BACI|nr:dipicolinate synthase subunit DpsA [Virgibacillus soli]MDY0408869.1 dipicolinate synthase subunit DpsA [Virgibacillus soli]
MLENKRIAVIGGDTRYIEVMNRLIEAGLIVQVAGFKNYRFTSDKVQSKKLKQIDFSIQDAILLPVSGANEKGKVELAPYADEELYVSRELFAQTKEDCLIYTGIAGNYLQEAAKDHKLIRLFHRDDMAILNAIPTAEGTLELAMHHTNYTIHRSHVLVLGFGRVGFTVARLFAAVGAYVTVCVRSSTDAARITEMGMKPIYYKELEHYLTKQQIIINTVPARILNKKALEQMDSTSLMIDLASSPGGVDFKEASKLGIHSIHALGLPGKVAPKTAGNIIADVLLPLLEQDL